MSSLAKKFIIIIIIIGFDINTNNNNKRRKIATNISLRSATNSCFISGKPLLSLYIYTITLNHSTKFQ